MQKGVGPQVPKQEKCLCGAHACSKEQKKILSSKMKLTRMVRTEKKTFFGAEALQKRFAAASAVAGAKAVSDLREFRAFGWMLTSVQSKAVSEWQREAVATSGQRLKSEKAKMLKDVEESAKSKKKPLVRPAPTPLPRL